MSFTSAARWACVLTNNKMTQYKTTPFICEAQIPPPDDDLSLLEQELAMHNKINEASDYLFSQFVGSMITVDCSIIAYSEEGEKSGDGNTHRAGTAYSYNPFKAPGMLLAYSLAKNAFKDPVFKTFLENAPDSMFHKLHSVTAPPGFDLTKISLINNHHVFIKFLANEDIHYAMIDPKLNIQPNDQSFYRDGKLVIFYKELHLLRPEK